jgi:branched-chain amino acid aminotransferase
MSVWLNGRLLPADQARLDPSDRGLLLGDGLFETMRAAAGRLPLLPRHMARLRDGASLLGLPAPSEQAVADAARELLEADDLADAAVRLTLTRGPGPRGLLPPDEPLPTLLLTAAPLPPAPAPVRAVIATVTRRNERSPLARVKALGYLDQLLALREARNRGADDALLLNTKGRLACATAANLFLARGRELLTPPVAEGALPGVTRALVLELAPTLGLTPRERPLAPSALDEADAVLLTGSLRLVTPVAAVDGRGFADPGRLAQRIAATLTAAAAP